MYNEHGSRECQVIHVGQAKKSIPNIRGKNPLLIDKLMHALLKKEKINHNNETANQRNFHPNSQRKTSSLVNGSKNDDDSWFGVSNLIRPESLG